MYPDAPVEADDNQVEVVAQAEPGVETKLLVEAVETENLVAGRTGDACEPDVPYVEKYRTVQGVPDGKAEFEVGLQPQVAELAFEAGVPSLGGVARSEGSHRPAAHAVAASHVEHAVHREGGGVAVGESDAAEEPVGHGRPVSYRDGIADTGIHAEILRVADAEYFVECFVPWGGLSPRTAVVDVHLFGDGRGEPVRQCVGQVACRFRIDAYRYRIALAGIRVVEEIGARDGRYVLRFIAFAQVAVLDGAEEVRVDEAHVHEVEVYRTDGIGGVAAVVPRIADVGSGDGAVVFRFALQVGRYLDARQGTVEFSRPVNGEGGEEPREGDGCREPHLVGVLGRRFVRVEFVSARQADVEQFGTAEQVAVEVADGWTQRIERRRGGGLEVERVALPHGGRAEDVAVERSFEGLYRGLPFASFADVGDVVVVFRFGFGEGHAGILEVVEPLQVTRCALLVACAVKVVGVDGDGPAQCLRLDFGLA